MSSGGGGGRKGRGEGDQLSTFGPESKSAKILYSPCWRFCWEFSKFLNMKCANMTSSGWIQMVPVYYVYAEP